MSFTTLTAQTFIISGRSFVDFFSGLQQTHPLEFPHRLSDKGFTTVCANLRHLTGQDAINLYEFVAHFLIIYNETGGSFMPVSEKGSTKYFFNPIKGLKKSYNQAPNHLAGDQLFKRGIISSLVSKAQWNSQSYPQLSDERVKIAAQECDFYKFRGRGLNQITWRNAYEKLVNPVLVRNGYKMVDELSTLSLDATFTRPEIYCSVFSAYLNDPSWCARVLPAIRQGDYTKYPLYVAGFKARLYQTVYLKRAAILLEALKDKAIKAI